MHKLLFFLLFPFFCFSLYTQTLSISGQITDMDSRPLEGVFLKWQNSESGIYSDAKGNFNLEKTAAGDTLIITHVGFKSLKIFSENIIDHRLIIALEEYALTLPPFEVSAQGAEQLRYIPGKSESIARESIPAMTSGDVTSVFKYLPDMQIIANGAGGSLKTIKLNGFNSSHVAFQLDGIPLNSAQNGGVDLSLVNLESLEKIVIKYGGNSVDAGSSALGGVINMSVLPQHFSTSTRVSVGYGSYNNYQFSAVQTLGENQKSGFRGGIYYRSGIDNFSYLDSHRNEQQVYNAEFSRLHFQLGGLIDMGRNSNLKVIGLFSDNFSQIPAISPHNKAEQSENSGMIQIHYNHDITKISKISAGIGIRRNYIEYNNLNLNSIDEYTNDQITSLISYQLSGKKADWRLIGRLEGYYYAMNSTPIDFIDELSYRFTAAAKYGLTIPFAGFLILSAGGSAAYTEYDDQHRYDYRLGLKSIWSQIDLYSSLYSGYKVPTFNDRYWPNSGNPDLLAEESLSWLNGIGINISDWLRFETDLTIYTTSNMIRWIPEDGVTWRPYNLDAAKGTTIAVKLTADFSNISMAGGITYQDVTDNGQQLRYVPKIMGAVRLSYKPFADLQIFAGNFFESDRPLIDGGLGSGNILSRYAIIDIGLQYEPGPVKIVFKINNISNELYFLQSDLPMKGIHFESSLSYTI